MNLQENFRIARYVERKFVVFVKFPTMTSFSPKDSKIPNRSKSSYSSTKKNLMQKK